MVLNGLQSCLISAQSWMSMNKLKLNPDKTEFLLIGNKQQWSKYLFMLAVVLFGVETNAAKSARNLGVIFDKNIPFRSHVSAVCSSCFYNRPDLRGIHRYLATALVSSTLVFIAIHFCVVPRTLTSPNFNSIIQNRLVHVVTKSPPVTRSIPSLRSLHWLPVRFSILPKISLLTYKTLHEKQPVYLHSMPAPSLPSR